MFTSNVAVECGRLETASQTIPNTIERYAGLVAAFKAELQGRMDRAGTVIKHATSLWETATLDSQRTKVDDRALYWGRLQMEQALLDTEAQELIPLFEEASRNCIPPAQLTTDTIVLTGFDPFNLENETAQSNPSGAFVLALHGSQIGKWRIHSLIFPVRYADFDANCVENSLKPLVSEPKTRLVVTVSMGRERFDLERFPANCRGSTQPDNQGVVAEQSACVNPASMHAPGFLEFTLPATRLRNDLTATLQGRVIDNRSVSTLEDGDLNAQSLAELEGKTPRAGSGGNFLSNEISYRTLLLQRKLGTNLPIGHIHVPRMVGFDPLQLDESFVEFVAILKTLVQAVDSEQI